MATPPSAPAPILGLPSEMLQEIFTLVFRSTTIESNMIYGKPKPPAEKTPFCPPVRLPPLLPRGLAARHPKRGSQLRLQRGRRASPFQDEPPAGPTKSPASRPVRSAIRAQHTHSYAVYSFTATPLPSSPLPSSLPPPAGLTAPWAGDQYPAYPTGKDVRTKRTLRKGHCSVLVGACVVSG